MPSLPKKLEMLDASLGEDPECPRWPDRGGDGGKAGREKLRARRAASPVERGRSASTIEGGPTGGAEPV